MGFVTYLVETADGFLDDAAESQFGALAATIGNLGTVACSLVVVLVFVNMALQVRSMDGRQAFWLCVKMVLVAIFAQSWAQFDTFSSAVLDGIDSVSGALVSSVGGGETGASGTFAEEFDRLLETMTEYLNAVGENLNWMTGALIDALGLLLIGLLGGLAAFILVFARLVVTLMIALAPLMIFLTLFEATKDYFLRWLSATISFALYPVVVAGIFATIIGVSRSLITSLGAPTASTNIGALLPFFMMILMAKGFILATPFIVRSISGNVVMPAMVPLGMPTIQQSRYFGAGLLNTKGSQERYSRGMRSNAEIVGATTRSAGQAMQRMMARNQRLSKQSK
ncbi:type IV secretion system protein [Notoacmeibacter ruber]|uniref:Type IV secretion system protein n=1 Tax=Notoacmeibacter ruber TaxID=2670375 RepID=A0A3L7J3R4_9HYPH|nr:type IV secretion system protein [Notoacmeibacter ruber]RLQ84965.1 type IV secretion system protein [Notoacmeibacter ruber]